MSSRKIALQTLIVAAGQAVCVGAMFGVFALLGKMNVRVLLGGLTGAAMAIAYFFSLAVVATLASERAEKQDVEGGQKLIKAAYLLRLLALAALLVLFAMSGYFHVVALVLPLAFIRPILIFAAFFRKKGD